MSNKKSLKEIITEAVQGQLPAIAHDRVSTVDSILTKWWASGRQDGLRLTEWGDMNFRIAEIEFYQADFKLREGTSHHAYLLELNKKIKCPYYLGVNKESKSKQTYIRFYDSKIAMMVELYGSLNAYLDSIKVKR
jgi:hypothetical protein